MEGTGVYCVFHKIQVCAELSTITKICRVLEHTIDEDRWLSPLHAMSFTMTLKTHRKKWSRDFFVKHRNQSRVNPLWTVVKKNSVYFFNFYT